MQTEYIIELTGVVSALIYTWLELKQRSAMWIVGTLSSLMYIAVSLHSRLYAYAALYCYYVAVSIYGLYKWKFEVRSDSQETLPVTHTPVRLAIALVPVVTAAAIVLRYALAVFDNAPMPALEAAGTALSIAATWMLARKYLEHWLVWIVADSIMAAVFFFSGRYLSAGLGVFYTAAAVYGYFKWRKL